MVKPILVSSIAIAACALATLPSAEGHGYLTCPKPRMYRDVKPVEWSNWMGITVPGDGSFNPGEGNAPNLNAGIGGGVVSYLQERSRCVPLRCVASRSVPFRCVAFRFVSFRCVPSHSVPFCSVPFRSAPD